MELEFIDKYMLCWLHMAFQTKAAAELLKESRFKQICWHLSSVTWSNTEIYLYCHINWSISLVGKKKQEIFYIQVFCSIWSSPQEYLGFSQTSGYC